MLVDVSKYSLKRLAAGCEQTSMFTDVRNSPFFTMGGVDVDST